MKNILMSRRGLGITAKGKSMILLFENAAGKLATIRDAAAADGSYGPAVNAEIAEQN